MQKENGIGAAKKESGATAGSGKVLCFEWARGIAAAAVVLIHVTSGIMSAYPVEAIGGGAIRCLVTSSVRPCTLGGAGFSDDIGSVVA